MNVLVLLVIILLGAAAIGFFVYDLSKNIHNIGDVETCRESILLASQTKRIANEPYFNLQCTQQELLIKKKDIVEDGIINQDKAHKIIANAMADQWS